ncbi:MAG TPA: hypothetical protein PL193_07720 [Xanthobacteraceae bacterium]|nr:hypothetical protein [Xanthobacteraceae bacterium]
MITDRKPEPARTPAAEVASRREPWGEIDHIVAPLPKPDADRLFDILDARFRAWTGVGLKEFPR